MKNSKYKKLDETSVYIEDEQTAVTVKEEQLDLLQKTVMQCLKNENFKLGCEINILLTDNESIRQINKQHRDIDKPTDVLSFPMADIKNGEILSIQGDVDIDEGLLLLGDIIISMETALKQSEDYGHSLDRELAFLTAHGVFHLLGYDHIDKDTESDMISRQEAVLEKLGLRRE
jgi:probable rRNA maturation factor